VLDQAIARIHQSDFETLVDVIFARSGWYRTTALGGALEFIDLALADFIDAYNFGRRLNTLKGLTPYLLSENSRLNRKGNVAVAHAIAIRYPPYRFPAETTGNRVQTEHCYGRWLPDGCFLRSPR